MTTATCGIRDCEAHVVEPPPSKLDLKFAARPILCRLAIHQHYRHTVMSDYWDEDGLQRRRVDEDIGVPHNSNTCLVCGYMWTYSY